MKINTPNKFDNHTAEGAIAAQMNSEQALRRSVMSCLLWEDAFYEDGQPIAKRIQELVAKVAPEKVAQIAIEARVKMNLRHVPLLIVREMARLPKHKAWVAFTLERVIERADELTEFVAIYWKDGRQPLSAQVKRGLAAAFLKFDAYQLAKYNRDGAVKLRDVLFLCHAKPQTMEQKDAWKRLVDGNLPAPDTWEVSLSAGKDKRETWERLINENKLGGLALLRNLRNMEQAKVPHSFVAEAINKNKFNRVLPFRFVSAAKAAPQYEEELDSALLRSVNSQEKIPGRTVVVVDISGSMDMGLSSKSDMTRMVTAATLGAIAREMFSDVAVYATAGNDYTRRHATALIPNRHGMALIDAIPAMTEKLGGGGIFLNQVCQYLSEQESDVERMIVITDEQDCAIDSKDAPTLATPLGSKFNYLINVSVEENGIGYGKWTHIDGFSEAIFEYVRAIETDTEEEEAQ